MKNHPAIGVAPSMETSISEHTSTPLPSRLGQKILSKNRGTDGPMPLRTLRQDGGFNPSKHYHNYGKAPLLMGKSTISMAMFNSKFLDYQAGY